MNEIYDWKKLESIIIETKDSLFNFIYRMTFDRDSAEDIFQETWLRAVKNINKYNPLVPFKVWLFHIAKNLCRENSKHPFRDCQE